MRYRFDHDLHIHTRLSPCAGHPREQSPERILQYAKEEGLHTVCVTDHYWDEEIPTDPEGPYRKLGYAKISSELPLPSADGIRFLFGCESDLDVKNRIGIPTRRFNDFDFMIIPTTHLHFGTLVLPPEECEHPTVAGRASAWVQRLDAVLSMPLPFHKVGIAHPASPLVHSGSRGDYLQTLDAITTEDMERLFARAAELGVGIEINRDDMCYADSEEDTVLRMFRIAKHQGCKFYCGSDAHTVHWLVHSRAVFERAIDRLGLTEADKFILA